MVHILEWLYSLQERVMMVRYKDRLEMNVPFGHLKRDIHFQSVFNIHNCNNCVNIQMQFFKDIGLIVGSFFCKQAPWTIFDFESGGCIVAMQ